MVGKRLVGGGVYRAIYDYIGYYMSIRKIELVKYRIVGVTKEVYLILRLQKKVQKKSMMRLVNDLILEKYGNS